MYNRALVIMAVLFAGSVTGGCGGSDPEQLKTEDTFLEVQVEALNEASEVNDMLLEQHEERDAALRRMGG